MPVEQEAVGQAHARVESIVGKVTRVRRPGRGGADEQIEGHERDDDVAAEAQRRAQSFVLSELSELSFDVSFIRSMLEVNRPVINIQLDLQRHIGSNTIAGLA